MTGAARTGVAGLGRDPDRDGLLMVALPGDKSISHRALMLAAMAEGTSRLEGLLSAADPLATARVLRALGARVPDPPDDGSTIEVVGGGLDAFREPARVLDCENSGTTARLIMGLLSARSFSATLDGDLSLRSRPMRRVTEPLSRMGARFEELGPPDRLPIRITGGRLRPIVHESPRASAQIKSAVLLAGLAARVPVEVVEPIRSRDHTERLLMAMGADVSMHRSGTDPRVALTPADRLEPLDLRIPGDFSSAAFLAALGLLLPLRSGAGLRLVRVGVNPTRTGLLEVLERMGAAVDLVDRREAAGEPVADLVVRPAELMAADISPAEIPALVDEVPVIAVLAARAHGETRIRGAGELRVKETDRLAVLAENLTAIGAEAEELEDGLVVVGSRRPLAGTVRTRGDHRIAMAFGVLAALPDNRIQIDDPDCVSVSFPAFWTELDRIAAAFGYGAAPADRSPA